MKIVELIYWIKERESIRRKKEAGKPRPWTTDPNLRDYRYTNVRRNDDPVTKWIYKNWLQPHENNPNVHFAAVVARLFNNTPTLSRLGFPENGYPMNEWGQKLLSMKQQGERIFNPAYIVSTNGRAKDKSLYVLEDVLLPIWEKCRAPKQGETLESYAAHLQQFDGMGSFLSGQVIADLKEIEPLMYAEDWWSWSNPGPGSKRGFNYVFEKPIDASISPIEWVQGIKKLQDIIFEETGIKQDAQNVQNNLCELSKYTKLLMKTGKPKQGYPGV